jgi:hypothetical protein
VIAAAKVAAQHSQFGRSFSMTSSPSGQAGRMTTNQPEASDFA